MSMKQRKFSSWIRLNSFWVFPILTVSVYIGVMIGVSNMLPEWEFPSSLNANIVGLSGSFIGFLLTILTFMNAFPENQFIASLKKYGHFGVITRNICTGIILYIVALLLALLEIHESTALGCFLMGLTDTLLAGIHVARIAYYIGK